MATMSEALKEAYASAPSNLPILQTMQLVDSSEGVLLNMVNDRSPHTLNLEDGSPVDFEPVPFRFNLPPKSAEGLQDLNIAIDNVDRRVSEFVREAATRRSSISVHYRPYLANDPTQPQTPVPLVLALRDLQIDVFEVRARAAFADIINKGFSSELYTRERFPSLGG